MVLDKAERKKEESLELEGISQPKTREPLDATNRLANFLKRAIHKS